MIWNLDTWKVVFAERLPRRRQRMQHSGSTSLYAFVSAMALWPAVAAVQGGTWAALAVLGSVVAGVGGNLLANRLQSWKDEADGARQLATALATEPGLRAEIDAVLEKLDAVAAAKQALPEAEHQWFTETLQRELASHGTVERFTAQLTGSGAIAQGTDAIAAGQGSVVIGGSVHGNVVTTGTNRQES